MRSQRAKIRVNHRRNLKRNLEALETSTFSPEEKQAMRLIYTSELEKVESKGNFSPKTAL